MPTFGVYIILMGKCCHIWHTWILWVIGGWWDYDPKKGESWRSPRWIPRSFGRPRWSPPRRRKKLWKSGGKLWNNLGKVQEEHGNMKKNGKMDDKWDEKWPNTWMIWAGFEHNLKMKRKTQVYIYIYMCVWKYLFIYLCIYILLYIHIYIYTYGASPNIPRSAGWCGKVPFSLNYRKT